MAEQQSNHTSKFANLKSLGSLELLRMHGAILDALKENQILRTTNNPTGDYAELLAAGWLEKQGLVKNAREALLKNSHKGVDAIDDKGASYQVKGRRLVIKIKGILD